MSLTLFYKKSSRPTKAASPGLVSKQREEKSCAETHVSGWPQSQQFSCLSLLNVGAIDVNYDA